MKDLSLTIEFVTHCLSAGRRTDDDHDSFDRDNSGNIIWRQPWWHAAMLKAIELAGLRGVKPGFFYFDPVISVKTEIYKRKYGRDKYRSHEAIMPGTELKVHAMADDAVTEKQANDLFTCMGRYVGLSPFGYNLGFGKFEIKDMKLTRRQDDADDGIQPVADNRGNADPAAG